MVSMSDLGGWALSLEGRGMLTALLVIYRSC